MNTFDQEIRIVVIGRTGSGKSATGNSLLNTDAFHVDTCAQSVTSEADFKERILNGKKIVVIDTPGLFDNRYTEKFIKEEIIKCIGMSVPGPHAFLFVMKIGDKVTKQETDTLEQFYHLFGSILAKFVIVVFTKKRDLDGKQIGDYLKDFPEIYKKLFQNCDGRIISIENKDDKEKKKTSEEILKIVEAMSLRHDNSYYTDEMYKKATEEFLDRMKELGDNAQTAIVRREIKKKMTVFKYMLASSVGVAVGVIYGPYIAIWCAQALGFVSFCAFL